MSDREAYLALQVHREMIARMLEGKSGADKKAVMSKKPLDLGDVSLAFFGSPHRWVDAQPMRDFIRDARAQISSIRTTMRPDRYEPAVKAMRQAEAKANVAVRAKMNPKAPTKAYPTIRCQRNRKPEVIEGEDGGVAVLSVNWMRSVHKNHIAVASLAGEDIALVVRARRYPSVFLAEMGVTCFEAEAMRLGLKARRVEGYVFHVTLLEKHHVIMNPDFKRGVTAIKKVIEETFHEELAKVQ